MTDPLLHTVLIYGHAISGFLALGLGLLVFQPRFTKKSALFSSYYVALWGMVALLVAVVLVDWSQLPPVSRITFGGLTLLALYTGFRGWQARQLLYGPDHTRPGGWQKTYLDHVGFTLISLLEGFVIVGAIDMNAPGLLVGGIAVLGVAVGIGAIQHFKGRLTRLETPLAR